MRIEAFFLFGVFIVFAVVQDEVNGSFSFQCKEMKSNSTIMRLKQYLFCEYDRSVRPSEHYKNATTVYFGLTLQSIVVYEDNNVIDLSCWTSINWKDFHLTWEPSEYDDIKSLRVNSYEIWVPDISIHSSTDIENDIEIPATKCWLHHNGYIYCLPSMIYATKCIADHTWWPYDVMNCTVVFGMWSHSSEEIQLDFIQNEALDRLTMDNCEKNLAWDTVRIYITERVETSKFGTTFDSKLISYHILLKRHATMYSVVYILPSIVLMMLTLMTLWLDPKSTERMLMANINFILHLLAFQNIHWHVSYSSSDPPKLLLLYENSFLLATFSLILTNILRNVQNFKSEVPAWVSSTTAVILRSKVGQILLISMLDPKVSARIEVNADDNTNLVSFDKKESTWTYISILIGWIIFLSFLIAYIVILAAYLPTSTSEKAYALNS